MPPLDLHRLNASMVRQPRDVAAGAIGNWTRTYHPSPSGIERTADHESIAGAPSCDVAIRRKRPDQRMHGSMHCGEDEAETASCHPDIEQWTQNCIIPKEV